MRGPGAVPSLFALESEIDELAVKRKIDPVTFRMQNEPKIDEGLNVPFSSPHLAECMQQGANTFRRSKRDPAIGATRDGDAVLGWVGAWPRVRGSQNDCPRMLACSLARMVPCAFSARHKISAQSVWQGSRR